MPKTKAEKQAVIHSATDGFVGRLSAALSKLSSREFGEDELLLDVLWDALSIRQRVFDGAASCARPKGIVTCAICIGYNVRAQHLAERCVTKAADILDGREQ